jgi:Flp pilus assembly protein TadG
MFRRLAQTLRRSSPPNASFKNDRRGGVAVIFALALLPLVTLAGAATDYSRATMRRSELQRAVDAAVIAGALLKLEDKKREKQAEASFRGALPSGIRPLIQSAIFTVDKTATRIEGDVVATVPMAFMGIAGYKEVTVHVQSTALIAKPQIRQLDLVMCIDATGSMQATIDAVKSNALNFEANLNAELKKRSIDPFDAMRVRVVFFRDFGGNWYYDPKEGGWYYGQNGWVWIAKNDPHRARYVGDVPPLKISDLWRLPDERNQFSAYVQPEKAWGGGDLPESGLECVNEGMDTKWAKGGDGIPGNGKKLTGVYPVIVVWTDADAHKPSHTLSLSNPDYPPTPHMPRDYAGLTAKWNDPKQIDQNNKMLVFFGNSQRQGWKPLRDWNGFIEGGSLTDGTTDMVRKIADAIASKISTPTISH